MELVELLKGCRPIKDENGNIIVQSIMNMKLVCLTTDDEFSLDDKFDNDFSNITSSNSGYGTMGFENNSKKPVILPTQLAVITKQQAQNHGMIKAAYIKKNSSKGFNDAGCVQGSQTGYFRDVKADEFRLIPLAMREGLFNTHGQNLGYSRIYPHINNLGNKTKVSTNNYLDLYFSKYDKKLKEFIAHFERLDKTIGVIILIDDEIVSVDKFPSFTYCKNIWNTLIRDCYSSLALISQLENKRNENLFTTLYESNKKSYDNFIDKLDDVLNKTKIKLTNDVNDKLTDLLEIVFSTKNDSSDENVKSIMLENEGYIGQCITESNFHYLVSVVKKESFDPKKIKKINELKKLSKKQSNFKL